MALHVPVLKYFGVFLLLTPFFLCESRPGFYPQFNNLTAVGNGEWSSAGATWYGSADGGGSDGGACGYGALVTQPPFGSMVTAVGPSLYNDGKECGACYQVKCDKSAHPACSGIPKTVVITDSCPGGPCANEPAHFDLSGHAFGSMAIQGEESTLRDAGVLEISFSRVPCEYPGQSIAFRVDAGSNQFYFATIIEFEQGDGDLAGVDLAEATTGNEGWKPMQQSWGALWKLDGYGSALSPPFSIRLTTHSGNSIVAKDVIPANWQAGATYRSIVNFPG
ncbi:hypothetical protein MLD38_033598 [Melastoma candidum]|uniref:Uncharacterized protein n=1 Tax=Melastoma candidum TaxID=119954 RepID=A0ACB9M7A2_9MYRT|nr:hypothetical protein MLD38_033598 [Melastoma candidum]